MKWIETRSENFLATIHGRGQVGEVELGVMNDGTIRALRYDLVQDVGAYYQLETPAIVELTVLMMSGSYKISNLEVKVRAGLHQQDCDGRVSRAGRPEATYVLERCMDIAALELGMDPVEIRRRNFLHRDAFPYSTPCGSTYDSGDYTAALDKALEMVQYDDLRRNQAAGRQEGRYIGIGLATFVEICGMGPSSALPAGGWESATVRIHPTGKIVVLTGASPPRPGAGNDFRPNRGRGVWRSDRGCHRDARRHGRGPIRNRDIWKPG